mmetsp:Transcript_37554/g.27303  ORF Transcript_37554/g.27303 Transcript_37554/m.27303 type:complete len:103 (-) Transcript_37554:394-702(-)
MNDIDVSILINNVGYASIGPLEEISDETVHNVLTINMYSVTLMSKLAVDRFIKRFQERNVRSLILNTDALASVAPIPYAGLYSASKNFGNFVSEGIHYELRD